jgi:hypothetical protein
MPMFQAALFTRISRCPNWASVAVTTLLGHADVGLIELDRPAASAAFRHLGGDSSGLPLPSDIRDRHGDTRPAQCARNCGSQVTGATSNESGASVQFHPTRPPGLCLRAAKRRLPASALTAGLQAVLQQHRGHGCLPTSNRAVSVTAEISWTTRVTSSRKLVASVRS